MSVEYSRLDFSKMMCNVYALQPGQHPGDIFKDVFYKHKEFHKDTKNVFKDKLFKYIPYVYDKGSPLREIFDDLKKLKVAAAELSGFIVGENGHFNEEVEAVILCTNPDINAMIIKYIILHRNPVYQRFVLINEIFYNASLSVIAGSVKMKDFNDISTQLEEVGQILLNRDNSVKLEESLYDYYLKDRIELSPEDIAKKLEIGELPFKINKVFSNC